MLIKCQNNSYESAIDLSFVISDLPKWSTWNVFLQVFGRSFIWAKSDLFAWWLFTFLHKSSAESVQWTAFFSRLFASTWPLCLCFNHSSYITWNGSWFLGQGPAVVAGLLKSWWWGPTKPDSLQCTLLCKGESTKKTHNMDLFHVFIMENIDDETKGDIRANYRSKYRVYSF